MATASSTETLHTHTHTHTRKRRRICETECRIQQAKRTKEEKQAVHRGREHMCSVMYSARAECRRRDDMVNRGEREREERERKQRKKLQQQQKSDSRRKWSSHSGLEKEIWRSQRPRGGEREQREGQTAIEIATAVSTDHHAKLHTAHTATHEKNKNLRQNTHTHTHTHTPEGRIGTHGKKIAE